MKTIKTTPSKNSKFKHLSRQELAYLAGLIDGDGRIGAQIKYDHELIHKFAIVVTIGFHQRRKRAWFLNWIGKKLKTGSLNRRNSAKWDWTIYARDDVKDFLVVILPYLKIKRKLAHILIDIIDSTKSMDKSKASLLKVMKKVDETAYHTDSKFRIWTSLTVQHFWETGQKPERKKNKNDF